MSCRADVCETSGSNRQVLLRHHERVPYDGRLHTSFEMFCDQSAEYSDGSNTSTSKHANGADGDFRMYAILSRLDHYHKGSLRVLRPR